MLDGYTCTECGRCRVVCPTALTGKPLDPKIFIGKVRDAVYEATPAILAESSGRGEGAPPRAGADRRTGSPRTRSGRARCAASARRPARSSSSRPSTRSPRCAATSSSTRRSFPRRSRRPSAAWRPTATPGTSRPRRAPTGRRTCRSRPWRRPGSARSRSSSGSAARAPTRTARSGSRRRSSRSSNAAGVSFAILGNEETCTGDSARRMGNEYLFQMLAQQNVETLNNYKVRKVVTNCPHCMNCLKNEYGDFGGHYEVVHGSQLVVGADRGPAASSSATRDPGDDHVPRPLLPRPLQRRSTRPRARSSARSRASS